MGDTDISATASDIIKGGAIVILGGAAFIVVVQVANALLGLLP